MADSKLNYFVASGTNAERLAFTPVPPTPSTGPDPGYFFYETDTGNLYAWDGAAWDGPIGGGLTAASTTEQLTGTSTTKAGTPDSVAALWEQGSDVASAGTVSLGEGGYFNITGTTTITDIDFATDKAGRKAWVKFAGILTLTHNASTLILPTGANITTAAGDTACFVSEGTDVIRCVAYNRADGTALTGGSSGAMTLISEQSPSGTGTVTFSSIPGTYRDLVLVIRGRGTQAAASVSVSLRFNSDSGANYYRVRTGGTNATSSTASSTGDTAALVHTLVAGSATASKSSSATVEIYDYRGTTFFKSLLSTEGRSESNAAAGQGVNVFFDEWNSTSAITQVDAILSAGNWDAGSVVSLYGRM